MKRVVITGGGGYLGGHLHAHLLERGGYEVTSINRSPRQGREILIADVADWDSRWTQSLEGAHAVVHLASRRNDGASWDELRRDNVQATLNVLEAAAQAGARRVIFASSSWVLGGYFRSARSLEPTLKPKPSGRYAATKMIGEFLCHHFASRRELSVICLRIGSCHRGEELPNPARELMHQHKWLSIRDFCHGMERAIETPGIRFSILHLASDIVGSRWDISETRRLLDYMPQDRHQPKTPPLRARVLRRLRRRLPRIMAK